MTGKLLDNGCLTGHFVEIDTEFGWNCKGIELHEKAYNHCIGLCLDVLNMPLEKKHFENKTFDAVTLWDIMEHIPSPNKQLLNIINYILKDNGLLFLLVPNGGSLAAKILYEKCNMFNGCQHINLFSQDNIDLFLAYYLVLEKKTIISEFSVLSDYLNYNIHTWVKGRNVLNY